jgi:predicted permease
MVSQLALFASCAATGALLQRGSAHGDLVRARLWQLNYAVVIPLAATYAFLSIELDLQLVRIVLCGLVAWWLTVGLAGAYAGLTGFDAPRRGALWLVGAFPNTGFIGFPLAHLVYGAKGLRLAVIYDQVSLVLPAIVLSTIIALRHGTTDERTPEVGRRSPWRDVLVSPPVWAVAVLLAIRATIEHRPLELTGLGEIVAAVVGPIGFLLLGLPVPLGGFTHARREVAATLGAVVVRIVAAPCLVWLVAAATRTHVPPALLLVAAMPTAFHALVVGRVHGLDVGVLRLGLLVSTTFMVGAVLAWMAASS